VSTSDTNTSQNTGRPQVLLTHGLASLRGRNCEPFRRYMLEAALAESDVWMFDAPGQDWHKSLATGATEVDVFDAEASVAAALTLRETVDIIGVWGVDEATIVPAAKVAQALGLPGLDPTAATAARDKSTSRALFRESGVPQPQSIPVADLAEAAEAAAQVGYPLIAKPRALGSSLGVVKIHNERELATGYAAAKAAKYHGTPTFERDVLIETYIDGPEISIDGYCHNGQYEPQFIAHKSLGFAPYFEEVGHVVDAADPLVQSPEIRSVLQRAHSALGLRDGLTHSEIRLTSAGPILIEINGRPGGDYIPMLGKLATGQNPLTAGVRIALGRPVGDAAPRPSTGAAAIQFLYPPYDCRVEGVEVLPGPDLDADAVELQLQPLVISGVELRLPPRGYVGRWAYLLASGPSVEGCEKAIAANQDRLQLHATALDVA
jgi:biotin carboxylase